MTVSSFLAVVVGSYLVIVALAWSFQAKLVFYPSSRLTATPADIGLTYEEVKLTTSDGVGIHGWFIPGPKRAGSPAALFFHGNAGNISNRLEMIRIIHDLGLACLIIDYRGYGRSGGTPSEQGLYRDSRAAWSWLVEKRGCKPKEVVVWGRSLGGAVAAGLAAETSPGALIVESCFTSMPDLGQKVYPFLPARYISRFRFPAEEYLQRADSPILVVHSRDDEVVPVAFGRRLFEAAPEPKQFLEISGGHNEGFIVSEEKYIEGLRRFLSARLGQDIIS